MGSDDDGVVTVRGWYGGYEITAGGRRATFDVARGAESTTVVVRA